MVKVFDEGIILEKTELEFENKSVFNPTCIEVDGVTHMFYRAFNNRNISSIGYCQLVNNKVVKRAKKPVLFPEHDYEKKGLEDPRITFLDGEYFLFYTVYDGKNALIAYATSSNLPQFTKQGLISPKISYSEAEGIFHKSHPGGKYNFFKKFYQKKVAPDVLLWEKDACLFPKKFNQKYALLHRVLPGIQIIFFDDFSNLTKNYWRSYFENLTDYIVLEPYFWFENFKIGAGCTPLETKDGWLIIHHAVETTSLGNHVYHATAALLDLNNPLKVIGRLKQPLFSPTSEWEKNGMVNNVVFPTGAIVKGDKLFIYYGAADSCIGAKSMALSDLLNSLTSNL